MIRKVERDVRPLLVVTHRQRMRATFSTVENSLLSPKAKRLA